jgi:hypothetical protein
VGARCHAATEHLSTIGLGVWFELQASVCYSASHYIVHCLLLRPFPGNVPVLPLVSPAISSSFTLVRQCWNFSSHSCTLRRGKPLPLIVLKVFDGFQLLVHLQTTKNESRHAVLPWCKTRVAQPFYCVTAQS